MKLATLTVGEQWVVAAVDPAEAQFWPVADFTSCAGDDMLEVIRTFGGHLSLPAHRGRGRSLTEAKLEAPLRPPRAIMCVGKNYRDHAREFTQSGFDSTASSEQDAIPEHPIIFTKMAETVIGPDQLIVYPDGVSDQLDYEAELAVVIGVGGRSIPRARALDHVFGFTILNDVTARDLQARHKQWFIGKSLDTFCPMGPWITTRDEVDHEKLDVRCWVNGELRQHGCTEHLIFDIPTLISALSAGMTLVPGDVIATGTPAGVGVGYRPPRFLARGDEIAIEITNLGRLVNTVG